MRTVERFPNWVPTPLAFHRLDDDTQQKLIVYDILREAEENERVAAIAQSVMMAGVGARVRR